MVDSLLGSVVRPRRAWPGLEEREAGQEDSPRVYLELTVVAPGTEDDVSVRLKEMTNMTKYKVGLSF